MIDKLGMLKQIYSDYTIYMLGSQIMGLFVAQYLRCIDLFLKFQIMFPFCCIWSKILLNAHKSQYILDYLAFLMLP